MPAKRLRCKPCAEEPKPSSSKETVTDKNFIRKRFNPDKDKNNTTRLQDELIINSFAFRRYFI